MSKPNLGNIRYFENIDTNTKAYFVGFIAADGSIGKPGFPSLSITLHSKDVCILDKLKEEIGFEHKIQTIKQKSQMISTGVTDHVRIAIQNKLLIQDLNALGIYNNKSLTIGNIILNIPYKHRNAFIIGYLDGDGSVTLPKGNVKWSNPKNKYVSYPSYRIVPAFRGTESFLQGIKNHLRLANHVFINGSTHQLTINNKEDVVKLFNCYKDLNFFLTRKHDKFLERINHESYQLFIGD